MSNGMRATEPVIDCWEQFRPTHQVEREAPQNRTLARAGRAREQQRAFALQQPVVERNGGRLGRLARRSADVGGSPGIAVLVELPSIVILAGRLRGPVLKIQRRLEDRIGRINMRDDEALADVAPISPPGSTFNPGSS